MADMSPKPYLSLAEKLSRLDKLSTSVNKSAGKTVMGRIGANPEIAERLKIKFLSSVSRVINELTGGGYPRRRTSIIVGEPDSGKTTRMLEDIAYNMRIDPTFVAGWLESENSLKLEFIINTFGIDPERFVWMEHDRDGAAEVALDRLEAMLATGSIDLCVVNSLKCLVPKEEQTKSIKDSVVAIQARMNSRMTKKFTPLIAEHDTAFVIITHLSTSIGSMYRDPLVISGGKSIIYASSLTLDFRKKSLQDTDPISRDEGMKIGVSVLKNHCVPDRNPYLKADYFIIYGEGTEQILSTLEQALKEGHLVVAGAFIRQFDENGEIIEWNGTKLQFQGKEKFRTFCKMNPDYLASLQSKLDGKSLIEQMDMEEVNQIKAEENAIADLMVDLEENETNEETEELVNAVEEKKIRRKKAS